jgi:uncharacterized membrane-anchored protein
MKKLFVIALLMVGMTIFAQERNRKQQRSQMEQFTPEQKNQLHLKRLTLHLDLDEKQQKEMNVIITEMNAKRETQKATITAMKEKEAKPTAEERFAMKSKMLDEQIVTKKRMEKILSPKQFEKWEQLKGELRAERNEKMKRSEKQNRYKDCEYKF